MPNLCLHCNVFSHNTGDCNKGSKDLCSRQQGRMMEDSSLTNGNQHIGKVQTGSTQILAQVVNMIRKEKENLELGNTVQTLSVNLTQRKEKENSEPGNNVQTLSDNLTQCKDNENSELGNSYSYREEIRKARRPWKVNKEQLRKENIDRMAFDIMAREASKIIEEAYKEVFERANNLTDSNDGEGMQRVEDSVQDVVHIEESADAETKEDETMNTSKEIAKEDDTV